MLQFYRVRSAAPAVPRAPTFTLCSCIPYFGDNAQELDSEVHGVAFPHPQPEISILLQVFADGTRHRQYSVTPVMLNAAHHAADAVRTPATGITPFFPLKLPSQVFSRSGTAHSVVLRRANELAAHRVPFGGWSSGDLVTTFYSSN